MRIVTLTRVMDTAEGTFGELTTEGFSCVTVERPWLNNETGVSCIPVGEYLCEVGWSSKNKPLFNKAYQVMNVPHRDNIKIHIANYPKELEGCIGLGDSIGAAMVTNSKKTIEAFHEFMEDKPFVLIIKGHVVH